MTSPARIPLPASPVPSSPSSSSRSSASDRTPSQSPTASPRARRPPLDRASTSRTVRASSPPPAQVAVPSSSSLSAPRSPSIRPSSRSSSIRSRRSARQAAYYAPGASSSSSESDTRSPRGVRNKSRLSHRADNSDDDDDLMTPTATFAPDPFAARTYPSATASAARDTGMPPSLSTSTLFGPRRMAGDPFTESTTITVNQPVGSLSISPSHRDVCLASRKGLYILDLQDVESAPRFVPQGGTWQIADCQWSPHPSTSNLILSTSSQKLLVWDLLAARALHRSIDAHARAITDINWHALNPNLIATVAMDAGIRGWDLRIPDNKPFMRLCAWGAAGTQVKWNRKHEHIVATAHGKEVIIWDDRKGSVPVTTIKGHDGKIYGIDWDRRERHKLVTCSLDRTIKFWTIPELAQAETAASSLASEAAKASSTSHFFPSLPAPDAPDSTVSTTYPVWRARNLPFGHGVLALPQRGETALEMFTPNGALVESFEGHGDVVKEFVWRARGGADPAFDDREFQLVTWGKDRTLRIWPVAPAVTERAGWRYGAGIDVLVSRRGAENVSYTKAAGERAPAPAPSGIARARPARVEAGMTRGGGMRGVAALSGRGGTGGGGGAGGHRAMDQLEWLTKVVKHRAMSVSDSSAPSRSESVSRGGSRPNNADGLMSLKDEVVYVHKLYPKPKINFERVDLAHRKLTISLNGPWANGERLAFIRIHWSFPASYPYSAEIPTFELERNATVSPLTRFKLVSTIKEMRAANHQCLAAVCGYLLGYQERPGRRLIEESDDESDKVVNVPMLARTCGATFGPNGQLVCFFPKQTVLPRARGSLSRSPSVSRDPSRHPLFRAITALSRLENPHKTPVRVQRRHYRRPELPQAVQAGSTVTIHAVPAAGPDAALARAYGDSVEGNLRCALDAGRTDHAVVWAMLRGLLSEPPAPLPVVLPRKADARRERAAWERSMGRKRQMLDAVFASLMAAHDFQLLALMAACLRSHEQAAPPPPAPETTVGHSPETDYFALPRIADALAHGHRSSLTISPALASAHASAYSHRTSGWSQILLNPSSISLRSMALTPRDRTSFDIDTGTVGAGASGFTRPSLGGGFGSYNDHGGSQISLSGLGALHGVSGMSIPTTPGLPPGRPGMGSALGVLSASPRKTVSLSTSPQTMGAPTPGSGPATADRARMSYGSNGASPLRRHFGRQDRERDRRRKVQACSVKVEMMADDSSPSLIPPELLALAELWKLAYADYLLRLGLHGRRTALLQQRFVLGADGPANGALSNQSSVLATVCRSCEERVVTNDHCAACMRKRELPLCAVCREPIRGLSTTCTTCTHTSHTACLRAVLDAPAATCPACLCRCLAEHGLSGAFMSARLVPHVSSPATARGFLSPAAAMTSLASPGGLASPGRPARGAGHAEGASSKTVEGGRPLAPPQPLPPRSAFASVETALGLTDDGGLLSRARKGAADAILGRK